MIPRQASQVVLLGRFIGVFSSFRGDCRSVQEGFCFAPAPQISRWGFRNKEILDSGNGERRRWKASSQT
jgi:hypothetical protein